jgi:serine/threonine protein kinase
MSNTIITKGNPREIFELVEHLGAGSFGVVMKARIRATGQLVAVKRIVIHALEEVSDLLREINILSRCDCEDIVKYYGTYQEAVNSYWV